MKQGENGEDVKEEEMKRRWGGEPPENANPVLKKGALGYANVWSRCRGWLSVTESNVKIDFQEAKKTANKSLDIAKKTANKSLNIGYKLTGSRHGGAILPGEILIRNSPKDWWGPFHEKTLSRKLKINNNKEYEERNLGINPTEFMPIPSPIEGSKWRNPSKEMTKNLDAAGESKETETELFFLQIYDAIKNKKDKLGWKMSADYDYNTTYTRIRITLDELISCVKYSDQATTCLLYTSPSQRD